MCPECGARFDCHSNVWTLVARPPTPLMVAITEFFFLLLAAAIPINWGVATYPQVVFGIATFLFVVYLLLMVHRRNLRHKRGGNNPDGRMILLPNVLIVKTKEMIWPMLIRGDRIRYVKFDRLRNRYRVRIKRTGSFQTALKLWLSEREEAQALAEALRRSIPSAMIQDDRIGV